MNPRHLLTSLLDSLDANVAAEYSMLDHHARGLKYLNLLRTDRLTIKLYIAEAGKVRGCGNGDYLVNPHNHAYAFDTFVVAGKVRNVELTAHHTGPAPSLTTYGDEYIRYDYRPRAKERTDVRFADGVYVLNKLADVAYHAGGSYHLDPKDIHTLILNPKQTTLLLLTQYHDVAETTSLYVPAGTTPQFDGLYHKPTTDDVREMVRFVREVMA